MEHRGRLDMIEMFLGLPDACRLEIEEQEKPEEQTRPDDGL